jgi:signal transduction histidine kinase
VLENRLIRGAFTTERLDAVKLIAGQLAVSLDNAESRAQLIASRARIVAAADDARRRIQRDLHDGAQQRVVTLALTARALASSDAARAADLLDLAAGLDDALRELRDISSGLHPAVLSRGGLKPTLTALARRSPIPVALDARMSGRLAESIEIAAYYLVAETLTNAAKHANASRVDVTAESLNGALRIRVQDDGIGGADPARGSGLIGLRDRVEALGGTISIDSPPGRGTTLIAELPLDDTAATAPERARA